MIFDESEKYLCPKKGDRLLRAADDRNKAVSFQDSPFSREAHIWDGYVRAGAALIDECERSDSRYDPQVLVYPLLFCYRHGLEQAMKWIIAYYGKFAGIEASDFLDHDLWKLWKACKEILVETGYDEFKETNAAVEQIVKDFHDLDKGSFSIRYSRAKNGATIRLPDVEFDLANIKRVMKAVDNFFKGTDSALAELEDPMV